MGGGPDGHRRRRPVVCPDGPRQQPARLRHRGSDIRRRHRPGSGTCDRGDRASPPPVRTGPGLRGQRPHPRARRRPGSGRVRFGPHRTSGQDRQPRPRPHHRLGTHLWVVGRLGSPCRGRRPRPAIASGTRTTKALPAHLRRHRLAGRRADIAASIVPPARRGEVRFEADRKLAGLGTSTTWLASVSLVLSLLRLQDLRRGRLGGSTDSPRPQTPAHSVTGTLTADESPGAPAAYRA